MPSYSPDMQAALAKQLRRTDTRDLELMLPYFEQRQGDGLTLLRQELQARQPLPATPAPGAPGAAAASPVS